MSGGGGQVLMEGLPNRFKAVPLMVQERIVQLTQAHSCITVRGGKEGGAAVYGAAHATRMRFVVGPRAPRASWWSSPLGVLGRWGGTCGRVPGHIRCLRLAHTPTMVTQRRRA